MVLRPLLIELNKLKIKTVNLYEKDQKANFLNCKLI